MGAKSAIATPHTRQKWLRTPAWLLAPILGVAVLVSVSLASPVVAQTGTDLQPRARIVKVEPIIAPDGELWVRLHFEEPWGESPPFDLFSMFFGISGITGGQQSLAGWEWHDGVSTPFESTSTRNDLGAVALDDGTVVVATGLFPVSTIDMFFAMASWLDETTTTRQADEFEVSFEQEDFLVGDPLEQFGAPTYNLITNTPIAPTAAPPPEEESAPPEEESAPPPEETASPPEEESAAPTEELAQSDTSTGGDPGLSIFVWILIAAFVALFGWGLFWYFFRRPQRLYRFDRGDPGEFVDEEDSTEIISGGIELPTFGSIEEGEEVFLPPRGSEIEIDEPPAHRLCDGSHEAWRESVEQLTELEQEADDRVGTDDPIPEIHHRMINEARASMDAYRRIYEECLDAHPDEGPEPPAPSGSAPRPSEPPPPDDADSGGGETETGGETNAGPPGIITPPGTPSDPTPKPDCVEGSSKIIVDREKTFTVAGENITILGAGTKARFGGKGISGADLSELDSGELEDIFEGIEEMGAENRVTVTIPTKLLTVKCIRVMHCTGGKWVETDHTRVEETAKGPSMSARWRSQEQRGSGRQVTRQVKPILAKLQKAQGEADAFTCD